MVEDVPRRYYVQFWKRVVATNPALDICIGTVYWSDSRQKIMWGSLYSKYATDVEILLRSGYTIGHGIWFSPTENPKEYIRNLHKTQLPNQFYVTQYGEDIDEV